VKFDPDWCIAPGVSLRSWRDEQRISLHLAARLCGLTQVAYGRIELGQMGINQELARQLEEGTGISAEFWLARERDYREGLAQGLTDTTPRPGER
jgi:transcriptional regulator with XRE-family HTH domain